jgi:hypothetical protein
MDSITLPVFSDTQQTAIESAFSDFYGYQANIPDPNDPTQTVANTQTIDDFVIGKITDWIDNIVLEDAQRQAIANISATPADVTALTPASTAMTAMTANNLAGKGTLNATPIN